MIALDPVPHPIDTLPARGAAGDVALEDRAGTLDYAGLEAAVGGLAHWLSRQGLAGGDRVASWLHKTRTACLMPLAAPRAGLVHVPVNPVLKRAQVAHILADSGARLLVTQASRLASLEVGDVAADCGIATEDEIAVADRLPPSQAQADALAAILYTSGSTGLAKGVMLTHANLWLGAISVAYFLQIESEDCVLGMLPLSFDYGQNQLFSTWAAGARVVPLDYLAARDVVKAVERFGATTLAGVPPLWVQLLEAEWPGETAARLRRLTNSGGALTPAMVRGLRGRFPNADLYPMYGLTEAFRSTYLDPRQVDARPDSIGRAIPFAEVIVMRADGARAEPGEPGELVHAGPLVAQGYWRDPERTARRFRPAPEFATSGGMAVWSGDTVVEDADGLLRFVGRDDEMIKSAGNRISPTEIEQAVLAGGDVVEAVAFGVPDSRLGQAIVVVARGDGTHEGALRDRLRRELPSFMQPARYEWRADDAAQCQRQDRPGSAQGGPGMTVPKPMGPIPPEFANGMPDAAHWIGQAGGTPLFVYDLSVVAARIERLRSAMPKGVDVHYAVKANPFPPLLAAIAPLVDGMDVASAGELERVLGVMAAKSISFAGPGKRDFEIEAAIRAGVTLNIELESEAGRAMTIAEDAGVLPKVAVRVNPDFELRGSGMKMGGRASPFGVDAARVPELVGWLIAAGADWRGFHIFAGSQSLDSAAISETQAATVALAGPSG